MTTSPTHRLSQVERAMAQLADTLRMLETRDQQRRDEELRMREQERHARDEAKREWNRERGEIARKLSTVVEDIVARASPGSWPPSSVSRKRTPSNASPSASNDAPT